MTRSTRICAALLIITGCRGDNGKTVVVSPFGYLADTQLEQLRLACPGKAGVMIAGDDRPREASLVFDCSWTEPSEHAINTVTISTQRRDHRIDDIAIVTTDRAAAGRALERFVAPIVPEAVRVELRRNLDHWDSELRLEAKGGRLDKYDDGRGKITWSFTAYVP